MATPRPRCRATTKTGKRCKAAPTAGGLCFFHANPNKAVELGRKGGRKNRNLPIEAIDSPLNLNTAEGIRTTLELVFGSVYRGEHSPSWGMALNTIAITLLRCRPSNNEIRKTVSERIETDRPDLSPPPAFEITPLQEQAITLKEEQQDDVFGRQLETEE